MKKNVGTIDTVLRIILAVIVGILYLTDMISGTTAVVLGLLAVVLLATGLIGWCGLYTVFGITTCKGKDTGD